MADASIKKNRKGNHWIWVWVPSDFPTEETPKDPEPTVTPFPPRAFQDITRFAIRHAHLWTPPGSSLRAGTDAEMHP